RASRVQDLQSLLRKQLGKVPAHQWLGRSPLTRLFGSVAALIGQDQLDVPAPAQSAVSRQTPEGRKVVWLIPQTLLVEIVDRRVLHSWRAELFGRIAGRRRDACWLILEPSLVSCDLARLRRPGPAVEDLKGLPAVDRELVVIPHADKRPARPRILQVGIAEI